MNDTTHPEQQGPCAFAAFQGRTAQLQVWNDASCSHETPVTTTTVQASKNRATVKMKLTTDIHCELSTTGELRLAATNPVAVASLSAQLRFAADCIEARAKCSKPACQVTSPNADAPAWLNDWETDPRFH